jgi:hypothetical protein
MGKKKQLKQKGYALFGCPVEGCLYNHKTEQCRSAFARKGAFWRHLALRIFGQKKCELHQQLAQESGFPSDALEQPVIYFEYVTGVSTSEDTYLRQREFAQQLSELVLQKWGTFFPCLACLAVVVQLGASRAGTVLPLFRGGGSSSHAVLGRLGASPVVGDWCEKRQS